MLIKFCLFLSIIFISVSANAQVASVEVQRSTDKVILNGKVYFVHVVKKGETVYSIAKAYNIAVSELLSNNPAIANNEIKPEQVIRIPESEMHAGQVEVKKNNGETLHVVTASQTLYSISRIYNVAVSDIESINPEVKYDSLQINQVLRIPHKTTINAPILSNGDQNFIEHKVEKKETLYSIAKKYGVSQEDILKYNDEVAKEGLKKGKIIKIPIIKEVKNEQVIVPKIDSTLNTLKADSPIETRITPCDSFQGLTQKQIKIALLLPFFSSGVIISDQDEENQNEEKIHQRQNEEFNPISMNFMEFYQGVLLSLEELKKKGLDVVLYVYDTEKDVTKLDAILKNKNVAESDIIIGPAYPEQVKIVAEFAKSKNIIMISPVSRHEDMLQNNSNLFQVNPGAKCEMEAGIKSVNPDSATNIVVVYSGTVAGNTAESEQYKALLKERFKEKYSKIKELTVFNNDFSALVNSLDSMKYNYVISPVSDEIFATTLLGSVESKLVEYKITTIGLMDWTRFKGADMDYLFDQQMIYFTPYYVDYESAEIKSFLNKYRVLFGTEPFKISKYGFNYSMLGYDITNYFATGYVMYGKELKSNLHCIKSKPIMAPFEFVQTSPNGGYINTHMQSVQYSKDFQLVRITTKK